MLAGFRLHHGAEFFPRMRLHVLLHGYDFPGDGRRARGERRQRDESNRGRRLRFSHRLRSVRVRSVARRRVVNAVDNYDRQLRQRIT